MKKYLLTLAALLFSAAAQAQVPSTPPASGLCSAVTLNVTTSSASQLLPAVAAFTGTLTSTAGSPPNQGLLTTTSVTNPLSSGQTVYGTGVPAGTTILGQVSGTAGGAGVYNVSVYGTVSLTTIAMTAVRPACGTVELLNDGSSEVFFQLGATGVTAALPTAGVAGLNVALPAGGSIILKFSPLTPYVAALTSASTSTLRVLQLN